MPPSDLLDGSKEPIYDQIRAILGEHFENYCFIVMNEKGEVYYDYNHLPAGRMLINEMHEEVKIGNEAFDFSWDDIDDDDDPEEGAFNG